MAERAAWSLGICTGLGILLGACQLNDTDSAPPAPVVVDEDEPNIPASASPAQAGARGDDGEESSSEPADAAPTPSGSGASGSTGESADASLPAFPGLDAGVMLPTLDASKIELEAGILLPGFDAWPFSPGDLTLPDGTAIGPIDAGLALGD